MSEGLFDFAQGALSSPLAFGVENKNTITISDDDKDLIFNPNKKLTVLEKDIFHKQTATDILGDYSNIKIWKKEDLSEPFRELLYVEDKCLINPARDCEFYTRLRQDIINNPEEFSKDINYLENYRCFPVNSLVERGLFYSESVIYTLNRFNYLKDSSIVSIKLENDVFDKRYVYYITLPNSMVYNIMGYSVLNRKDKSISKYQEGGFEWAVQSEMVANLESLSMYEGSDIYITEGYFDALCINTEWGKKSIANLGNTISKTKLKIYQKLKQMGHILILVRDNDTAGSKLVENNIWDRVYTVNSDTAKDIDAYRLQEYVKAFYSKDLDKELPIEMNIHEKGHLDLPFYKLTEQDKLLIQEREIYGTNRKNRGKLAYNL